ncbi:MAG: hypothetical protein BAJALOKI1v1_2420012 [Promethearchaeota archaeon]|nr:MAG: hypothetical protein BAJALOKI1v1_2420012 [Candidatus Lokiarchaeota archaeon]
MNPKILLNTAERTNDSLNYIPNLFKYFSYFIISILKFFLSKIS